MFNNNNDKITPIKSMIEISFQILKKNNKPMPIYQLMKKVCQIKEINFKNEEKLSQLYLDIVSSGLFVFHGEDLWGIKENNLNLWDKEYYINTNKDNNKIKLDLEKEILNLEDLTLQNINESITEEEIDNDNTEEENLDLDLDIENEPLENNSIELESEEGDDIESDEDKSEEIMDDYDYLYENK
ncbi:MAG: DNA-directed RNA polymerase subunit delta [Weeping tea tree witches'-broom phytoplasma]|uniref:DNA-directed RNA polymerase subunit delta n=1 Tax=Candidatus Phytoplasma melaleucae TaxID=2982630 RepID=UPI0029395938|nr:DNA-directed RNA polymerase subunit delta [Weeping tea tree witches'-broom phytoplasma]